VTERVAIAEAIAERLKKRLGVNQHSAGSGNISLPSEVGQTRDLAAAKAGLDHRLLSDLNVAADFHSRFKNRGANVRGDGASPALVDMHRDSAANTVQGF